MNNEIKIHQPNCKSNLSCLVLHADGKRCIGECDCETPKQAPDLTIRFIDDTIEYQIHDEEKWHVYPVNDLYLHNTESSKCSCGARPKLTEPNIIVHNSWDKRELTEISN